MSKRTIGDYVLRGFLSRDKATVHAVIEEAEADKALLLTKDNDEDDPHHEPDGDEGGGDKHTIVNIHNHHENGDDKKNGNGDDDWKTSNDARLKTIEDGMKAIVDMMTSRSADGDLPPWLKKGDGGDDDKEEGEGEAKDADVPNPASAGEGAQTGSPPPSVEPDLMEADPALKMGPSMMGDSTRQARVNQAMNKLIRDTKGRAEVLSPGIKIGVLDGALGDDRLKQAGQRICNIRRQALTAACGTPRGMQAVGRHTKDAIASMSCDAVKMLFVDASDRMRQMNNAQNLPSPQFGDNRRAANSDLRTRIEAINKRNAEQWTAWGGTAKRA